MLWKMQQRPYLWRHGILISILVVSFMIFVLRKAGVMSAEYDSQLSEQELAKFNNQFEVYSKEDNTFFDVLTVANLAYDINKRNNYDTGNSVTIKIINQNNDQVAYSILPKELNKNSFFKGETDEQIYIYNSETGNSIIDEYTARNSDNSAYIYKFECIKIEYNDITGKVKEMDFKIVQNN